MSNIQESPAKKRQWLIEARKAFPVGTVVVVRETDRSDMKEYVGKKGTVVDYDVGSMGDWPWIDVRLHGGGLESFYDDELRGET